MGALRFGVRVPTGKDRFVGSPPGETLAGHCAGTQVQPSRTEGREFISGACLRPLAAVDIKQSRSRPGVWGPGLAGVAGVSHGTQPRHGE